MISSISEVGDTTTDLGTCGVGDESEGATDGSTLDGCGVTVLAGPLIDVGTDEFTFGGAAVASLSDVGTDGFEVGEILPTVDAFGSVDVFAFAFTLDGAVEDIGPSFDVAADGFRFEFGVAPTGPFEDVGTDTCCSEDVDESGDVEDGFGLALDEFGLALDEIVGAPAGAGRPGATCSEDVVDGPEFVVPGDSVLAGPLVDVVTDELEFTFAVAGDGVLEGPLADVVRTEFSFGDALEFDEVVEGPAFEVTVLAAPFEPFEPGVDTGADAGCPESADEVVGVLAGDDAG